VSHLPSQLSVALMPPPPSPPPLVTATVAAADTRSSASRKGSPEVSSPNLATVVVAGVAATAATAAAAVSVLPLPSVCAAAAPLVIRASPARPSLSRAPCECAAGYFVFLGIACNYFLVASSSSLFIRLGLSNSSRWVVGAAAGYPVS
jgi:hypothetical protein